LLTWPRGSIDICRISGGNDESASRHRRLLLLMAVGAPQPQVHAVSQAVDASGVMVRTAVIDGLNMQYLTAGRGPALVLLHGYTETSRMWRPVMPQLAQAFTVIAPDLPGIRGSAIPEDGVDMTRAAIRIHNLVKSLGIDKAVVVEHDIGLMVAYAYAAQFPGETDKLVLMDAFLPGIEGWEATYNNPALWHFRVHGTTPEALVSGRERTYFDYYWNDFAAERTRSLSEADRRAYAAAYGRPGRMRAAWAYFASFQQAATDFARFSQTLLPMPVLSIGGGKANGDALGQQVKRIRIAYALRRISCRTRRGRIREGAEPMRRSVEQWGVRRFSCRATLRRSRWVELASGVDRAAVRAEECPHSIRRVRIGRADYPQVGRES